MKGGWNGERKSGCSCRRMIEMMDGDRKRRKRKTEVNEKESKFESLKER